MPNNLFQSSIFQPSRQPLSLIPRCGECGLLHHCNSPKMPVYGEGKRKILVVGEGSGELEDSQGIPFVGPSGQLLSSTLARYGINLDEDCWRTNAIICRATTADGKNRTPTDKEISHCRPNLINNIQKLKPEIIIPLGGPAVKSLIGWLWREDTGNISRWDGWKIPCQKLNCWILPTWHPAAILHTDHGKSQRENEIRKMFFERRLEAASKLRCKPWETSPNYDKQVEVILDDNEAAKRIERFTKEGKTIAWDLETNMLKPDCKEAEIVACSISNGKTTIAYPWNGKAIASTLELLKSDAPKVGSNVKFEHRWILAKYGFEVVNWVWDTMVAAHVLDNRPGITSIKFQAFVMLGQDVWDESVKSYLKSEKHSGNGVNRIRECNLQKLLRYCALDSLLELKVGKRQAKQLGIVI